MASVVDGKRSVAGEPKENGQRLLIAHTGIPALVCRCVVTGCALDLKRPQLVTVTTEKSAS